MNIQIDAKGKQCPLPVIEAKNAISGMTEAGIVEVTKLINFNNHSICFVVKILFFFFPVIYSLFSSPR